MTQDVYAHLAAALSGHIEDAFDGKAPEANEDGTPWVMTRPYIVAIGDGDTPTHEISGPIVLTQERMTFAVYAFDLPTARVIKAALVAALDNFRGTLAGVVELENGGAEVFLSDANPPRWMIPVEFTVSL